MQHAVVASINRAMVALPPGTGPEELLDLWPILIRVGVFVGVAAVVVLTGWYWLEPLASRLVKQRNENNPTLQEAIRRYLRLLVVLGALVIGARMAGYRPLTGNSALVLAAGTLAIGVAGQTVIGSLVSGTVLVLDPEFNVGDYIEWEERRGTVRSITLRVTRVQTADGELITIPNTVLTGQAVTKPYGHNRRRIAHRIGVAYDEDVGVAMGHLEAVAAERPEIASEPTPSAYVDELASDEIVVRIHYWVDHPERVNLLGIRSAYAKAAKERLEAADIAISPPSKRDLEGRIELEGSG